MRVWDSDRCKNEYGNDSLAGFCPTEWDNYLCWPATSPGNISFLPCPRNGNDMKKFAFRHCLENGTWAQRPEHVTDNYIKWTNYGDCFNSRSYIEAEYNNYDIKASHLIEIVGLVLSIVSLVVSLVIFYGLRELQNNRVRIYKNIFIAMSILMIMQLILYMDQHFGKTNYNFPLPMRYACEAVYILAEYARTSLFHWMVIQAHYLRNMITLGVFQEGHSFTIYYVVGWGSPILLVLIGLTYRMVDGFVCWGFAFSGFIWVMEGPRLLVIGLNLLLIFNVLWVLVARFKENESIEVQQVRKSTRAAVILLPLLGITNYIQMIHPPAEKEIIQFIILSYVTTILSSFQGFFCALIYCFLNEEVQLSLQHFYTTRIEINQRCNFNSETSTVIQNSIRELGKQQQHSYCTRSRSEKKKVKVTDGNNFDEERGVDPFFEHWSDGELSAHNHVDIEQIEIPLEYFSQGKNKMFTNVDSNITTTTTFTNSLAVDAVSKIDSVSINSSASSTEINTGTGGPRVQGQGQVSNMLAKIDISRPVCYPHQIK